VGFEDILGGLATPSASAICLAADAGAAGRSRAAHLRYDLEISFEEARAAARPRSSSLAPRPVRPARAAARRRLRSDDVPSCQGRGQQRYQQGLLHGRAYLRAVPAAAAK
jgi:hypothetical protein